MISPRCLIFSTQGKESETSFVRLSRGACFVATYTSALLGDVAG